MREDNLMWETIHGQVISKANNYQIGNNNGMRHIIKSEEIRSYERSFKEQCRLYKDKHISAPFTLHVVVVESSRRYDLDNALKTLLDCLQMVNAITDDNLCERIIANKRIDKSRPHVKFAIEPREQSFFEF